MTTHDALQLVQHHTQTQLYKVTLHLPQPRESIEAHHDVSGHVLYNSWYKDNDNLI